jgi:hypothetical protein
MNIVDKLIKRLAGNAMDEYIDRFIMPQAARLEKLGVSDEDAKRMFDACFKRADPTVVGLAPGSLFRDMVDRIEAGETVDNVLSR